MARSCSSTRSCPRKTSRRSGPRWTATSSEHGPPAILLTVFWHARSSRDIFDRYEGTTVWAHEPSLDEFSKRAPVTNVFAAGDELPGGVEPLAMHHMDEAAFWLPSHGALLVGDSILGYEDGERLCPDELAARRRVASTATGVVRTAPSSGGRAGSY